MQRKGILAAGNFIIDIVKIIDDWPEQEALVSISAQERSNGGGAFNVLKDLAFLKADFPLHAMGCIGKDAYGDMVLSELASLGISTQHMQLHDSEPTSFTDVMTVKHNGKRTFFHARGANKFFDVNREALASSDAKIFYLAYLMLLDNLDSFNGERTKASLAFEEAKKNGLITTADIVSTRSPDFKRIVSSSLPYIDYFFINELEAEMLTDIKLTDYDFVPNAEACIEACKIILNKGVNNWVILHFPYGAIAVSKQGEIYKQGSVIIPQELIVGAVGAGDAFAAGVLAGVHDDRPMQECLKLGVATSAMCLQAASSSEGVRPVKETMAFASDIGYREL